VNSVTIFFDDVPLPEEPDFIYLDNIDVNGLLIGKPGACSPKKIRGRAATRGKAAIINYRDNFPRDRG